MAQSVGGLFISKNPIYLWILLVGLCTFGWLMFFGGFTICIYGFGMIGFFLCWVFGACMMHPPVISSSVTRGSTLFPAGGTKKGRFENGRVFSSPYVATWLSTPWTLLRPRHWKLPTAARSQWHSYWWILVAWQFPHDQICIAKLLDVTPGQGKFHGNLLPINLWCQRYASPEVVKLTS